MHRRIRTKARLLLAVSVVAFLWRPAPGIGADLPPASGLLEEGLRSYRDLDYEIAVDALREAEARGGLDAGQKALLYRTLAFCCVALGDRAGALEAFENLLAVDPDVKLSLRVSPKIREVFEEAWARWKARRIQMDHAAPEVGYTLPVQPVPYGQEISIPIRIEDESEITQAQLFFRKSGDLPYAYRSLIPQGGGVYLGVVPSGAVTGGQVEFYIVVIDEAGNAVLDGNTENFHVISVGPNPLARPWYKQWWIWGIVALAVGGATAAVVASTQGGDSSERGTAPSGSISFEF